MNKLFISFAMTTALLCANDQALTALSIKFFGAQGNGITDDTAAIQSGLNSACGERLNIGGTTGTGIAPIVVTTTTPHNFATGSTLTVDGVTGNGAANGRWIGTVLTRTTVALQGSAGNGEYLSGGTIAAPNATHLYFPAGTYNISSPLVTGCAMTLSGDGPTISIIFQTHQYALTHGIIANHSFSMSDMAVNTSPLTADYGMVGVFGGTSVAAAPMLGSQFKFVRFNSSGFNFAMDINGTSETDLLASITVENCNLSVNTAPNAVSQPINAANARFLTVAQSALTGDGNNDHAIYALAIRGVLIQNSVMQNHANSAIKLLQGGFSSPTCPTIQDYTSWTISNNTIEGSKMAIALYSFCALVMPSIVISNNQISNISDNYAGDYAAVYVQSNCQSNMMQVLSSGNTFTNLGLGGIVLNSQIEGDLSCAAADSQGTISNFISTGDTFVNWSLTSPGAFPAINSTGQGLINATVTQLTAKGTSPLNLSAFANVIVQ